MKRPTPDLDELVKYNRDACEHPDEDIVERSVSVGSDIPGVYGSHIETRLVCRVCGKDMNHIRIARMLREAAAHSPPIEQLRGNR